MAFSFHHIGHHADGGGRGAADSRRRDKLADLLGAHGDLVAGQDVTLSHLLFESGGAARQRVHQGFATNSLVWDIDEGALRPFSDACAVP